MTLIEMTNIAEIIQETYDMPFSEKKINAWYTLLKGFTYGQLLNSTLDVCRTSVYKPTPAIIIDAIIQREVQTASIGEVLNILSDAYSGNTVTDPVVVELIDEYGLERLGKMNEKDLTYLLKSEWDKRVMSYKRKLMCNPDLFNKHMMLQSDTKKLTS